MSVSARREADDLAMELEVRERADVAGLALEHDGGAGARARREVAIEAALADVERRAGEELRVREAPIPGTSSTACGRRGPGCSRARTPPDRRATARTSTCTRRAIARAISPRTPLRAGSDRLPSGAIRCCRSCGPVYRLCVRAPRGGARRGARRPASARIVRSHGRRRGRAAGARGRSLTTRSSERSTRARVRCCFGEASWMK